MLREDQEAYVRLYWARQRKANKNAMEAARKWEARKAELVARAKASGWDLNSKKFRDLCAIDYELNDHMNTWSWWEREAKRCHDAIHTEITATKALYSTDLELTDA